MQALILLDLQNDYGALGAMPVPDAEGVIPIVNSLMKHFPVIVATQDWHPANHTSFAANHPWRHPGQIIEINGCKQKLSIIHCVQNSFGAELLGGLHTEKISKRFLKGTKAEIGSHSGFYDHNRKRDTGMGKWLKNKGVAEVFILGLAIENSIELTAADALELDFKTSVIEDASRGMDEKNKVTMRSAGVEIVSSCCFNTV